VKDDRLYLISIIESAERIMKYVEGGRKAFMASSLIQDATIRNFETIGEAARHVSAELRRAPGSALAPGRRLPRRADS
jgi:uncharacterized protein with HEPN domain